MKVGLNLRHALLTDCSSFLSTKIDALDKSGVTAKSPRITCTKNKSIMIFIFLFLEIQKLFHNCLQSFYEFYIVIIAKVGEGYNFS